MEVILVAKLKKKKVGLPWGFPDSYIGMNTPYHYLISIVISAEPTVWFCPLLADISDTFIKGNILTRTVQKYTIFWALQQSITAWSAAARDKNYSCREVYDDHRQEPLRGKTADIIFKTKSENLEHRLKVYA